MPSPKGEISPGSRGHFSTNLSALLFPPPRFVYTSYFPFPVFPIWARGRVAERRRLEASERGSSVGPPFSFPDSSRDVHFIPFSGWPRSKGMGESWARELFSRNVFLSALSSVYSVMSLPQKPPDTPPRGKSPPNTFPSAEKKRGKAPHKQFLGDSSAREILNGITQSGPTRHTGHISLALLSPQWIHLGPFSCPEKRHRFGTGAVAVLNIFLCSLPVPPSRSEAWNTSHFVPLNYPRSGNSCSRAIIRAYALDPRNVEQMFRWCSVLFFPPPRPR